MPKYLLALTLVVLSAVAHSQSMLTAAKQGKPDPSWSVTLTGGYTNTFQLILGSKFGKGPDFQNKMVASVANSILKGDSLSAFGWSTTDIPSATPNWQAGLLYKLPLLQRENHTLSLTASGQRWILPMVGPGTKDWFVIENLTYGTSVKHMPVFVSEDGYTLVKSNLPEGSALYSQVYTQQPLFKHHGLRLALREGPAYTYSWGLYGCSGNRVFRYSAALITSWKGTALETSYRKQFGLQDKIPNKSFWSVLLSRQFNGPFHSL